MSEQEKAIPTEGTITETKDERSWLKKLIDNHPKAWKWAKRIGVGIGFGGSLLMSFELGKAAGGKSTTPEPTCIGEATEEDDEMNEDAE